MPADLSNVGAMRIDLLRARTQSNNMPRKTVQNYHGQQGDTADMLRLLFDVLTCRNIASVSIANVQLQHFPIMLCSARNIVICYRCHPASLLDCSMQTYYQRPYHTRSSQLCKHHQGHLLVPQNDATSWADTRLRRF